MFVFCPAFYLTSKGGFERLTLPAIGKKSKGTHFFLIRTRRGQFNISFYYHSMVNSSKSAKQNLPVIVKLIKSMNSSIKYIQHIFY